ncbi:MAG: transporter substrate-binding domain-containing protein, partial [Oscillospiraceae bacterium]|nr:transporter substrate-binding domain-containing protein [Oscillospiraceae bacterium]
MRKILALILAVMMLTCLFAGCTNNEVENNDVLSDGGDVTATSDTDYIMSNGKLIIGMTLFAPMNYYNDANELIGFETEFAEAVCEKIGVEPVFQEINWDSKEIELNAKNIDCIWNGMTITEERAANMEISKPYMENKQVLVV